MKTFDCDQCGQTLFFENDRCLGCQRRFGFVPDEMSLTPLKLVLGEEHAANGVYEGVGAELLGRRFRRCGNGVQFAACNWLVDASDVNPLCSACRLNELVPNIKDEERRSWWIKLEQAKRRALYSLRALGLPIESRVDLPDNGLCFCLAEGTEETPVTTGHASGRISIDVEEARPAHREEVMAQLGERYRTLLGHFRHELGHYYWERLVANKPERLSAYRACFGDERESYAKALERHYENGPEPGWEDTYVSAYATMHPWEDWAETWAHYLHAVDTLETAANYGLAVTEPAPAAQDAPHRTGQLEFSDFSELTDKWRALAMVLNSLNRSMGLRDAFPFSYSTTVQAKLEFVHNIIQQSATQRRWLD